MSAENNTPQSPDQPQKDKESRKRRPRSKLPASSTGEKPPIRLTSEPVSNASIVPTSLEVVLNPGQLLKYVVESNLGEVEVRTENSVLALLKDMVEGMRAGDNLEDLRVPLLQLTGNQEERAKLVRSLMLTNDYDRLAKYLIIRDKLEQFLLTEALNGKLDPAQGLSFLRTVREEISTIQGAVTEGAASGGDVTTLLNKVSFAAKAQDDILASKIKSSPQNRELVRKLIYRLSKLTRGKSTSK